MNLQEFRVYGLAVSSANISLVIKQLDSDLQYKIRIVCRLYGFGSVLIQSGYNL